MQKQVITVRVKEDGNVEARWKGQRCVSYDKPYAIRIIKKRIFNLYGESCPIEIEEDNDELPVMQTGEKEKDEQGNEIEQVTRPTRPIYEINERFGFVTQIASMVADGEQPSAIITGDPGLGKTYTVLQTLVRKGFKDISGQSGDPEDGFISKSKCFIFQKGYSTAKGLYRTLYNNNGMVIVFDDMDSVLQDKVGLNLLKGALDSYARRIISWNAEARSKEEADELPRSFEFTGSVIFISNMRLERIDDAVKSRSMCVDVSMNRAEKVSRMEFICDSPEFLPEYSQEIKEDAMALVKEFADQAKELSLRTLIQMCKTRYANSNWRELGIYLMTN